MHDDHHPLDDVYPPATAPCPPWCTRPAEHRIECETHEGQLYRYHEAKVAEITVGGIEGQADWARLYNTASIYVSALEITSPDGAQVLTLTRPVLNLGIDEGTEIDAAQARQLAAALLDGADLLDEIERRAR